MLIGNLLGEVEEAFQDETPQTAQIPTKPLKHLKSFPLTIYS